MLRYALQQEWHLGLHPHLHAMKPAWRLHWHIKQLTGRRQIRCNIFHCFHNMATAEASAGVAHSLVVSEKRSQSPANIAQTIRLEAFSMK